MQLATVSANAKIRIVACELVAYERTFMSVRHQYSWHQLLLAVMVHLVPIVQQTRETRMLNDIHLTHYLIMTSSSLSRLSILRASVHLNEASPVIE